MKKIGILFIGLLLLTGCTQEVNTEVSGDLTVVVNNSYDQALLDQVEADFIRMYPDVTDIIWEVSAGDYDTYITTKMTSQNYGDVFLVPFDLTRNPSELSDFLAPLGTYEDVSKTYSFADQAMYDDMNYALPISVNTLGIMYNEQVFKDAGVTSIPSSSEELLETCETVQTNTDATCWYSNLNTMPMLWSGAVPSYGGEQYMSDILDAGTIMQPGQPYYEITKLIYDMITSGYTEIDPLSGDYMQSEQLLADGEAGFIIMGSQSLEGIQAKSANPENIKMAPFPVLVDGEARIAIGPDNLIGIASNSTNPNTAKAFYEFILSPESGFAYANGGFSPQLTGNEIAPDNIAYLVEDFDTIRTIQTEDADVVEEFQTISNSAEIPSVIPLVSEVMTIAINDEDYQVWADDVESRWQQAVQSN